MIRSARRRALRRREAELPELAAGLARSVRTGATLRVALEEAAGRVDGPLRDELAQVLGAVRRGRSLDAALASWSSRSASHGVRLLVAAARLGHAHGGDLAAALEGAAASLLDRNELADEARALASQARTSALVLVALPPVGAAVFALADPAVARTLVATPVGWLCAAVGVSLDALGAVVIARLVRGALPAVDR